MMESLSSPSSGHQVGHLQGVGDVGGAVFPQLPLVAVPGEFKGRPDPCPLLGGAVLLDLLVQLLVPGLQLDEGVRRFLRRLLGLAGVNERFCSNLSNLSSIRSSLSFPRLSPVFPAPGPSLLARGQERGLLLPPSPQAMVCRRWMMGDW